MANQDLLNYVKYQVEHGVSKEEIIKTLTAQGGWE